MVECPTLVHEKARARIEVAGMSFGTPGSGYDIHGYINSFNINKARGNQISTMSAQIEIWIKYPVGTLMVTSDGLGPTITVDGGTSVGMPRLFTGYIKSIKGDPHFNDARKYILSISAEDVFTKMRNSKYSRRFKMDKAAFALIRGGERKKTGRMKQLERVNKNHPVKRIKVKSLIDHQQGHSPLYRTPEGRNRKTPNGRSPNRLEDTESLENQYVYTFSPSLVHLQPGQCAILNLYDETGNERLVVTESDFDSGKGGLAFDSEVPESCMCFIDPTIGGGSLSVNPKSGLDHRPASFRVISSEGTPDLWDPTTTYGKFIVCMNDWLACTAIYVDPDTKALAKADIVPVPIHDHSSMSQGGPVSATYIGV